MEKIPMPDENQRPTEAFFQRINRAEKAWVLRAAAVIMLVTSLPYLFGFTFQGENLRFTGFVFAVEDGNSYIAKMLVGAHGAWLFRTPYSSMPQAGVVMFLPYLILGKLAASPATHEQLVALFHLLRFFAGMSMILATYEFLALFIKNVALRRFGLFLAILGGGLGFLMLPFSNRLQFDSMPLEFFSPETFGFLSLYGIPHLAFAQALLLWCLISYLRFMQTLDQPIWQPAMKAGILWVLAGLMQPLSSLVIGFLFALHLAVMAGANAWQSRKRRTPDWASWRRLLAFTLIAGILPGIYLLYLVMRLRSDAFLQAWNAQNILPSPHFFVYLLAFGLLLPYGFFGIRSILKQGTRSGWLVVVWALSLPLLAYLPVNVQRRLPEGTWVAWCVLALVALAGFWENPALKTSSNRFTLIAPFMLCFVSPVLLLAGGFQAVQTRSAPLYRSYEEVKIFENLSEHPRSECVVIAAFGTGNALPAWAPQRVIIGHGPESAGLEQLKPLVTYFYSSAAQDSWRKDWLQQHQACYVFWGPEEQALGDWDPRQADYLTEIDQAGFYHLFSASLAD